MGATYRFTCLDCGYTADVDGGKSVSKRFSMITISCDNCKELSNVPIPDAPSVVLDSSWTPPEKACPKCNSNKTQFWQHPGKCPKCGKKMEKGEKVAMWD